MPRTILIAFLASVGAIAGFTGSDPRVTPSEPKPIPVSEYAISGPYTFENLSLFLLHGPDTLPPRNILNLDEALAQGKAVVHETGSVNTLCVENLSTDSDLMMQNGDIVKGGKQDRVLKVAMILPPSSGRVAVESFCVEQGRWQNRGGEAVEKFAANPGQIAGRELKMAVNVAGQQGEVWKNVAAAQSQLTANNGTSVTMNASPTSLQLATEDKSLQAKLAAYREPLKNVLRGQHRVVGYAIAVNGKITGAEVYGSSALMAKAWKKAVNAAALEAFAEKKPGEYAACNADSVRLFLADASTPKEELTTQVATNRVPIEVLGRSPSDPRPDPVSLPSLTPEQLAACSPEELRLINELQVRWRRVEEERRLRDERETVFYSGVLQMRAGPTIDQDNPVAASLDASRRNTQNVVGWNPAVGGFSADLDQTSNASAPTIQAPPVQVNRVSGVNGVLVESRDKTNPGVIVHRTFIAK